MLTVKILSPSHFITTDSIAIFSLNILSDILENKEGYNFVNNPWYYILSFINIIGCLIYNEIIIIRVLGLEYNTKKEINRRQKKELDEDKSDDNSKMNDEMDIEYSYSIHSENDFTSAEKWKINQKIFKYSNYFMFKNKINNFLIINIFYGH